MSKKKLAIEDGKPYKFKELKTYSSTEWLADNKKKYRQVFDRYDTAYIYTEVSLFNKYFDKEDWEVSVVLKCYKIDDDGNEELCDLPFKKPVSKYDAVFYLREGWGNLETGAFWKKGAYFWEAWVEGEKVATRSFYVEDAGRPIKEKNNPYFELSSIRMYEGPFDDVDESGRAYLKNFHDEETRYVYVEATIKNLLTKDWQAELFFKFYTEAKELKGQITRLNNIDGDTENLVITAGWGSNVKGSWRKGVYTVEIIFGEYTFGRKKFYVGDEFIEASGDDLNSTDFEESIESISKVKLFQIPVELRTAFQQYLLFFRDYVKGAKGIDIEYSVIQVEEGIEIQVHTFSEEELVSIKDYFQEYLDFARQNFVGVINVENYTSAQQIDILRMRIEQQVNNLNMEIKYKDLQIKMLEDTIKESKDEKMLLLQTIGMAIDAKMDNRIQQYQDDKGKIKIHHSPGTQMRIDCRALIKKDEIDEVFALLEDHQAHLSQLNYNDVILLQNQWANLNREKRGGKISFEMANRHKSFLVESLISLVDQIKD